MSDYIKREDAISALHGEAEIDGVKNAMAVQHLIGRFVYNIADIPSADVVERKKGEWLEYGIDVITDEWGFEEVFSAYVCSECDYESHDSKEKHNFCPNCGADMRAERKE